MSRYQTVAPLLGFQFDSEEPIAFAGGIFLATLPTWVREEAALEHVNEWVRDGVEESSHAFVASYPAIGFGELDPSWSGPPRRSIQAGKAELCVLAALALYLSRPSSAHISVIFHAPEGRGPAPPLRAESHAPLLCLYDPSGRPRPPLVLADLERASVLHEGLAAVRRDTGLWNAVWATSRGLQMDFPPIRYALLWIALEALFGPEDARGEITFRLSQRLAFFLERERTAARGVYAAASKGYSLRSKIVHGRWQYADILGNLAELETLVRRSLQRILANHELREIFASKKKRETHLDSLVYGDLPQGED